MRKEKPLVKLLALSEKSAHQRLYRLIKFYNCGTGKYRRMLILSSDLLDSRKVYALLLDQGLPFDLKGEKFNSTIAPLKETPNERVKLCERPGYVLINKKLCYLTHNGKTLGKHDGFAPMPYPDSKAFYNGKSSKGDLSGWQTLVAQASLHSPFIMLAICCAFAGYCVYFTDVETGGMHFFGKSSKGKSTVLLVATSVYSDKDYGSDWNITETGLEELAESRNHGLLILDEVSLLDKNNKDAAQKMQKIVYMLGAEGGKQRSNFYQPRKATWRLTALSNGELGLNEQAANGNIQRNNGEKVRFIDIPVDCESDMGIFETVPDSLTPSEYAENIKSACHQHYGVAGPAFVEKILSKGTKHIKKELKRHMNNFLIHHNISGLDGIEKRIAKRFALSYASGVLAVDFGILPFTASDVMEGISCCYGKATGNQRSIKLNMLFNDTLKQAFKNQVVKLSDYSSEEPGFKKEPILATVIKGMNILAIETDFFKGNIAHGYDNAMVLNILKKSGVLLTDKQGKSTRAISFKGKSIGRRYCLHKEILFTLLDA
ncbi:MAG: DUF927 domain-containing protein [Klebsiella huaxiensis]|uniref:DUF927 domain-containing protein n=1 Tax=Klebsiella huaxiensis TaxID=2153354 RepID=UPI0026EE6BD9|nr:DUF927 domain-containing protein [Klebsiella huaxiensis]WEJ87201.1 MAG: DUF927 domain-containing protein [Klebsiella huaxiensis]